MHSFSTDKKRLLLRPYNSDSEFPIDNDIFDSVMNNDE